MLTVRGKQVCVHLLRQQTHVHVPPPPARGLKYRCDCFFPSSLHFHFIHVLNSAIIKSAFDSPLLALMMKTLGANCS